MQDDRSLWAVLDGSAPGRGIALVACAVDAARVQSRAHRWRGEAISRWSALAATERMRTIGLALIAAVVVHVLLMLSIGPPGSWWTIVPALFGAFGLVITLLSFAGSTSNGRP